MEMEGGIDPDMPLDYVELQIFPSQNRYEAYVSSSTRAEKVASGTLEQLLLHSPRVKDLSSTGSNTNFKILPPDNANDAEWFTTATFTRFLHVVGSPSILSIGNEIAQLEETRKFQLSLSVKTEVDITSSIDSKNELLRAVDLRLTALKDEIADAFDEATGARCSTKDISDLENFAHHFGAKQIRDTLQKFVEMSLFPSAEKDSRNDTFNKTENSAPALRSSQLDPPIKYGVSPAKAAQVERQDSTDDENSSFSSEDDQPSIERSRAPTRSATPRRSASPMRRIQIGRSGSRRAAALTIKSLNYFPAREKMAFQRDAAGNSSDEEDPEKPAKNSVLRMSVQDKISLFESKQRDQAVDVPKTKTLSNTSTVVGANKAVLRRWSSGMGEGANTKASSISPENVAPEAESESCNFTTAEAAENVKPHSPERGAPDPSGVNVKVETLVEPEREEEGYEKHPASIEWSQQKEAELNQMFMEMMENNKPVRQRNPTTTDVDKGKKSPKEEKGGFYDHYKQKRDEKLRGEAAGKRAEKEAQFKVMQRFLDERKAEMAASTNVIDVNRKNNTTATKPQKTQKNSNPSTNPRKEASKPSVLKKATSKTSPLPATRKSWPSSPLPRATGASPARTPTGPTSATTTPTSRKPLSASSTVRSSTKSDKSQPRSKTPKPTPPPDVNRSRKTVSEKKQPTVTKSTKTTTKAKVRTPEADHAKPNAKPSFYNKVTKKGSVVPLETKPFLRKGSGTGPGVGPVVVKTKSVAQPEETLGTSGIPIQAEEENEVVTTTECEAPEPEVLSPTKCEEPVSPNQVNSNDGVKRVELSEINSGTEEESMISPTAWVEVDEHHHPEEIIPCTESPVQIVSPKAVAPARISSPRVRYSLSQMLLEDSSEGDVGEWGNAEHPPALVYQKDSPKGLKRLLKFARKAKADSHLTGWSSPPAFSEGDDEAEESKGQANISRFTTQNHPRVSESHASASVNTTKATRSFFSLSTFRGSKTNESKVP